MYIIYFKSLYSVQPNVFLSSYETITFSLDDGDKDDEEGFEGRILCFMM